ncbi:hypothetical protein ACIA8O_10640 [Kitasatospora sp. NPDC051853]|uniref:hypothetical protein n=1 Tax=Kitasatospora sp. NPDC051853 TaxID=3364058 RepID=UPI0037A9F6D0
MAEPINTPEGTTPETAAAEATTPGTAAAGTTEVELLGAGGEPEPAAPRRPVSTPRLLLAALLVGPLLGGAVGYAVQAGSPPTPLPALAVPSPTYPATPADPQAVAEAAVAPLKIDGDLRTLLLPRPQGTEEWDYDYASGSGWFTVGGKALSVGNSASYFQSMLQDGFRRDAVATWRKGDVKWRVELIQFHSDRAVAAQREVEDHGPGALPLAGVSGGVYQTDTKAQTYVDSTEQYYSGEALARRGDVVMRIVVFSPSQVDRDELAGIAKQQWERLV